MEEEAGKRKTFRHARIFLSVTAKEVCEGLRSGRFWLTVVAFLLLLMMDNLPSLYQPILQDGSLKFDTDIATICENSLYGAGFMGYLRFCFYAVPFACSFYEEYSHHAAKYRLVRSSVRVYGVSKMAANIMLTALSVLVSELLFVGSLRIQGVEWIMPTSAFSGALVSPLAKNHPIGYVLFTMAFKCLVAVYFASMVMMLSAFIRSRFVLLASPVALFFCLDSFSALWFASGRQPELTDWRILFFSLSVNGTVDEAAALARTGIYTACFVLLQILMFVAQSLTLLPYVTFSTGWGTILTTAAENPTVLYNYRGFGSVRPEIVQSMSPLEAMGKELILCILFGAVLGAVMFLVNGIMRKQYGAVLMAGLLFMTDFLYRIDSLYDTNFCMKSPFNWLDLGYYADGIYDFRMNVVILAAAFLMLAAANCFLTRRRVIHTT